MVQASNSRGTASRSIDVSGDLRNTFKIFKLHKLVLELLKYSKYALRPLNRDVLLFIVELGRSTFSTSEQWTETSARSNMCCSGLVRFPASLASSN